MKFEELYNKIKNSHALMMVLCCGIPLLLLFAAVYIFGISKSYLYWFILLLCPLMHFWMMKHMHKDREKTKKMEAVVIEQEISKISDDRDIYSIKKY